jgi:2',3'-cyclic-nucleotide 2'-phosphodiesterase (5'-nucleotidase family)
MVGQVKPYILRLCLSIIFLSGWIFSQEKTLYILHTNNTNGALENCYCPDHPFGAVEKRTVFISEFLNKHSNVILLDSGDIFTMTHQAFKDSLMAEAYRLLPYDAVLPGDQELMMDPNEINRLFDKMGIHVVATNITVADIEGLLVSHIVERDGLKIAILGIMDPYAVKYYSPELKNHIQLEDPIVAVKKTMKKLTDQVDIFVLLTHQGADLDYEMAEKIDGLHLIVGSHSQSAIEKPEEVNGTLIVQAGKEGYYVGIAELIISGKEVVEKTGRIDTMRLDMPDNPTVMNMIHEYEKKTGRINHQKLKLKVKK